jgi:5-methylcytosine-specific restriction protein A
MKRLQRLLSPIRNVRLSPVAQVVDDLPRPSFSSTAHLRLRGRALQTRNARVARRDGYTCQICGRAVDKHEGEVDHRIPLAESGTDDEANLQWLCREPCHRLKSQRESNDRSIHANA